MITEAIFGIVIMGLMTFFVYGMYLLETDKQYRWDELQKKKKGEKGEIPMEERRVKSDEQLAHEEKIFDTPISTNEEGAFDEQIGTTIGRPNRGNRFQRSLTARTARRFVKGLKAIRVARRERVQATESKKHRKLNDEN